MSQNIGRSESSVETLEKAIGPLHYYDKRPHIRLAPQELRGDKSFKIR